MKRNEKSIFKKLAQDAKRRMLRGSYDDPKEREKIRQNITKQSNLRLILANNKIEANVTIKVYDKEEKEKQFNEKIEEFLKNNLDSVCPFKELIDEEFFNSLDEVERQRYILDFSSRYLELRKKFIASSN